MIRNPHDYTIEDTIHARPYVMELVDLTDVDDLGGKAYWVTDRFGNLVCEIGCACPIEAKLILDLLNGTLSPAERRKLFPPSCESLTGFPPM